MAKSGLRRRICIWVPSDKMWLRDCIDELIEENAKDGLRITEARIVLHILEQHFLKKLGKETPKEKKDG